VKNENIVPFIPPIYYGKVIKIHSGDTFTIATKIPYYNETIETASIFYFTIYLNGVSAPKILPIIHVKNELANDAKNALTKNIYNQVVELRSITTDKHSHFYADVFLGDIYINEWLWRNNYVIKSKNGKRRRMSESDSSRHDFYSIDKVLDSPKKIDNFLLPPINKEENRPNSSSTSSGIQTDCFLSHNWGEKNKNHQKVSIINTALKNRGLKTWFDENKIEGNIRFKMAEGIDNTKCIVVFITKEYRDKVNGLDMKDNCKYEFTYAMNQLGSQNMIPVIMDTEMRDQKKWKGELGAALGGMLYIDFSDATIMNIELEKKCNELCKRIKHILHRVSKKLESTIK